MTDVTLAGLNSSRFGGGSTRVTGWMDVTLACGDDHLMGSNFTVGTRLFDVTSALLDISSSYKRKQCLEVLFYLCQEGTQSLATL